MYNYYCFFKNAKQAAVLILSNSSFVSISWIAVNDMKDCLIDNQTNWTNNDNKTHACSENRVKSPLRPAEVTINRGDLIIVCQKLHYIILQ